MGPRTLQSTLNQRAGAPIGRERERAALLELVERDTPLVAVVHGIAGVGKSTLLHAAAVDARDRGTRVVALDGRTLSRPNAASSHHWQARSTRPCPQSPTRPRPSLATHASC